MEQFDQNIKDLLSSANPHSNSDTPAHGPSSVADPLSTTSNASSSAKLLPISKVARTPLPSVPAQRSSGRDGPPGAPPDARPDTPQPNTPPAAPLDARLTPPDTPPRSPNDTHPVPPDTSPRSSNNAPNNAPNNTPNAPPDARPDARFTPPDTPPAPLDASPGAPPDTPPDARPASPDAPPDAPPDNVPKPTFKLELSDLGERLIPKLQTFIRDSNFTGKLLVEDIRLIPIELVDTVRPLERPGFDAQFEMVY